MDELDLLKPETLASARKARGLTQSALAAMSGVDQATICRIEQGATDPKVRGTWARLMYALGNVPCLGDVE